MISPSLTTADDHGGDDTNYDTVDADDDMMMMLMMLTMMTDECINFHILSNINGHQTVSWRVSLQSCTGPAREAFVTIPDQQSPF